MADQHGPGPENNEAPLAPPLSKLQFNKYDADGDGSLDADELYMAVLDAGVPVTREELDVAFRLADKDGSGRLEYAEFEAMWKRNGRFQRLKRSDSDMEVLQQCAAFFHHYDTDKNNSLDREEFARLHARLVEAGYTRLPLDECIAALDTDGNNVITYPEYVQWMYSIGSIALEDSDL